MTTLENSSAPTAEQLYKSSIIIDGCAPVLLQDILEWKRFYESGVTAIFSTVTTSDDAPETVSRISQFLRLIDQNPDKLRLVSEVGDFHAAKSNGQLGLVFQFQNARPIGRDLGMLDVYRRLGVQVIQLTYNYRNQLGDGCLEANDAGLSKFGLDAVDRMNDLGILVDLSHTGERTTLDAMEKSTKPDVFSHANAKAVYDHPRNLTDTQIKAVAEKNGLVGVNAFPGFINDQPRPTVEDLIKHLDYMVNLVGIDHVALGVDFFHDSGWLTNIELGNWTKKDWPAPPWHYPLDGANTVDFVRALLEVGYQASDVEKIMGVNFMRVLSEVWN
ncbi:dipeptidase [Brevibacterium zhoupengii]|uniref:dipeptidase n=1 Tax=Brevibacterium zhoupengii TaxID=2898795 RepID=UPI001F0966E0|nr:dipeptidase [Brevibacterium zhoupengii]